MKSKLLSIVILISFSSPVVVHAWNRTDAFGYNGTDKITFAWIPYDSTWIDTGISDDDGFVIIGLPFTFLFYGNTYTNLAISANGYTTFGTSGSHNMALISEANMNLCPSW